MTQIAKEELAMFNDIVSELPEEVKAEVEKAKATIQDAVNKAVEETGKESTTIALVLVGLENSVVVKEEDAD